MTVEKQPAGPGDRPAEPWAQDQVLAHLQVLVEGVSVLAGYEQSALSLRRGDDLEVVVAAGEGVPADFTGRRIPVGTTLAILEDAEEWGSWRFVPHDRVSDEARPYLHVSDLPLPTEAEQWHPLDVLFAPIFDDVGQLCGVLAVDGPRDGRRPGPEQLDALSRYAEVARTSILLVREREEMAERFRMASEAREIVREALGEPSLDLVLEACRAAILSCFDADGMWLSAMDGNGGASTIWYARDPAVAPVVTGFDDVVLGLAHRYWNDQYVATFSRLSTTHPGLSVRDAERLADLLDELGVGSVLFVPLGAGVECLGFLVLTRPPGAPDWTEVERDTGLDIGHDLGLAMASTRQFEQERAVVERLRRLDDYRIELVNTLAHELRNPLFQIVANLELLEMGDLDEPELKSVASALRGAGRMERVMEDLLTMARVADPHRGFAPVAVDLRHVLREAHDECREHAASRGVHLSVDVPSGAVRVPGRPDELHRVLTNLASNAVKYSDAGSEVVLSVHLAGDQVVVRVADQGLGISEEDLEQLFREFFRSTNADALERPGTGLGLAIVDRIVRRHSGSIDVESTLGEGTTVTVTLPQYVDDGASLPRRRRPADDEVLPASAG